MVSESTSEPGSVEPLVASDRAFRHKTTKDHNPDDLDFAKDAYHHTLGFGPNQAAPGVEFAKYSWSKALKPSYIAGWADWSDSTNELLSVRYNYYEVWINGLIRRTAGSTAQMFNLLGIATDEDLRPLRTVWRNCINNFAVAQCTVANNGDVALVGPYTNGNMVALDIHYFRDMP